MFCGIAICCSVTGIDKDCIPGMKGGNVLRKFTRVKLSVRIPPSMDPDAAQAALKKACEAKPTPWYIIYTLYWRFQMILIETFTCDCSPNRGASVECELSGHAGAGFVCPEFEDWLLQSMQNASQAYFGKPAQFTGEGGSIPFMGQLQRKFPESQFVITGILGPNSNVEWIEHLILFELFYPAISSHEYT